MTLTTRERSIRIARHNKVEQMRRRMDAYFANLSDGMLEALAWEIYKDFGDPKNWQGMEIYSAEEMAKFREGYLYWIEQTGGV